MTTGPQRIPVVLCFDAAYAPYAAVATQSLRAHATSALQVYWVTPSTNVGLAASLQKIVERAGLDIATIPVDEQALAGWQGVQHVSRATYLRFLIPDLIPDDRAIYLDCDTIVLSDLGELYATPMAGSVMAGVVDPVGDQTSRVPRRDGDPYLNSGVLLLDLDALRADGLYGKCADIRSQYGDAITWADQCILNKYAENRKTVVDLRWNLQVYPNAIGREQWQRLISAPGVRIVHFVGATKPWMEWCNPCVAEFWWQQASSLRLPDLQPVKMSNLNQMLELTKALDLNLSFEESSRLKGRIIDSLVNQVRRAAAR